jgi:hypothetical protein
LCLVGGYFKTQNMPFLAQSYRERKVAAGQPLQATLGCDNLVLRTMRLVVLAAPITATIMHYQFPRSKYYDPLCTIDSKNQLALRALCTTKGRPLPVRSGQCYHWQLPCWGYARKRKRCVRFIEARLHSAILLTLPHRPRLVLKINAGNFAGCAPGGISRPAASPCTRTEGAAC